MSIFRKRKDVKKTGFTKVYMPLKKKVPHKVLRKKKRTLFGHNNKPLRRRAFDAEKFKRSLVIGLGILFGIGFLYLSIIFIINLRKQKPVEVITENVVGLIDIPAFPGSSFLFENDTENTAVSAFISSGASAYKIPNKKSIEDVYEFYQEQLPDKGWSFIILAPIASESMESGQYWVKESTGLRIYTKHRDVWYETITKEQAESGLADRVKKRVERDLLLTNEDAQDLLPDFPWLLKVPREYVISYTVAPYENMRTLVMKKLGSEEKLLLLPIDKYHGKGLDYYLDRYVEYRNKNGEEACGIKKTMIAYAPYSSVVKAEVSCNDGLHNVAVIVNPNRAIVYILDSNLAQNPYFDEVLKNLEPQDSRRH